MVLTIRDLAPAVSLTDCQKIAHRQLPNRRHRRRSREVPGRRRPECCVMPPPPAGGNLLHALEIDLRAPVVEQRAQLGVLRVAQVALRLTRRRSSSTDPPRSGSARLRAASRPARAPPRRPAAARGSPRPAARRWSPRSRSAARAAALCAIVCRCCRRARARFASAGLVPIG